MKILEVELDKVETIRTSRTI